MKYLGFFTSYQPKQIDENKQDVRFLKNEQDKDWYELIEHILKSNKKSLSNWFCATDQTGKILSQTEDISTLFPLNQHVYHFLKTTRLEKEYILKGKLVDKPIQYLKKQALTELVKHHSSFIYQMSDQASLEERDSWILKKLAASAYLEGKADQFQIQMLKQEAKTVGETINHLAQTILYKVNLYQKYIGIAAGLKRKHQAEIKKCKTNQEVKHCLKQLKQDFKAAKSL